MKEILLSNNHSRHIATSIWQSEILFNSDKFCFVESFEKLCLKEFNLFKSEFSNLNIKDKDDVIKHWLKRKDLVLEKYYQLFPSEFKKFDLAHYYEIEETDEEFEQINYSDKDKLFYVYHYLHKFEYLIVCFLTHEENYIIESIINPKFPKVEFNPLEILVLESNCYAINSLEDAKKSNLNKTKGVIVAAFFRHLSTSQSNLARGKDERVIDYCNRINKNFNLPIHSRIETDFGRNEDRLESIKLQILPYINDIELKKMLEQYFNEIQA